MHLDIVAGRLAEQAAPVALVGVFRDEAMPAVVAGTLDQGEFSGSFRKTLLVHLPEQQGSQSFKARRVLLVGLGKRDKLTPERLRRAVAEGVLKVRSANLHALAVEVVEVAGLPYHDLVRATADGVLLASYRFDQYRGTGWDEEETEYYLLDRGTIVVRDEAAAAIARLAATVYRGVELARDLGNAPPRICTPTHLATVAEEISERGGMKLTVLDRAAMGELGMGAMLGVAQAAHEEPKVIVLEYGRKGDGPTVALVGKGITFDSGGISLKPAGDMDLMKMDMMGGAAVLGTMSVLADIKPPKIHVIGIVGATENLPGGNAFKPGDILTAMNGVTIEVLNTDAEGRLVLADCLSYVQQYEPDAIIDLATLTGAVVVGLGNHVSGLVTNNHDLATRVKQASDQTGELVWELPLLSEYQHAVRSKIADIKNTAGRGAGAITAGAFLEHFSGDRPWVHLDIAGVAWAEDQAKPYAKQGAAGFGVRLLTQFLQNYRH
ncbi:MAG: leucyl aminopeptidase [Herpetosiphon sp.]